MQNPHLFKIVTPIKVDQFEDLLKTHPNRPFVDSVCYGLRNGFWPLASISEESPITFDFSDRPQTEEAQVFIRQQRDHEISAGRFSEGFGPELLPGMYSSPIGAVPKPKSTKLRLITDQSAGPHSLNSFIPRHEAAVRYDNMQDFGRILRNVHQRYGRPPAYLFKDDCSEAFRRIPVHFLWQIRQVVSIDGIRHVDRCMVFGSRSSPRIWCSFMALVLWIAIHIRYLADLLHYMDDSWGYEMDPQLEYYTPYDTFYPKKQVRLLNLWDEIGLPHQKEKQLYGSTLSIIGFHIDPISMALSLPKSSRDELITAIRSFVSQRKHPLRDWQHILGWINWALNVFPLLRPGLQSSYSKISGKVIAKAPIPLNKRVISDLSWVADRVALANGLYFFRELVWDASEADLIIYCDACMSGLGFYIPRTHHGFAASVPTGYPIHNIVFFETLCVASAVSWASTLLRPPRRLLIYTDSLDSVELFHSLKAEAGYNDLLLFVVQILMDKHIQLRVFHIPGVENTVADALSRGLFDSARGMDPFLQVNIFQPPQDSLGVTQN